MRVCASMLWCRAHTPLLLLTWALTQAAGHRASPPLLAHQAPWRQLQIGSFRGPCSHGMTCAHQQAKKCVPSAQ